MNKCIRCGECKYYRPHEEGVIEISVCMKLWRNLKPGDLKNSVYDFLLVSGEDGCTFGEERDG